MLIRGLSGQSATVQALTIAELGVGSDSSVLMETPEAAQAAFERTFGPRKPRSAA